MAANQPQGRFQRLLFKLMGPAEMGPYGPPVPPPAPRPRDSKGRLIKEPKKAR
jgi:hypothetical protein